MGLRQLVEEAMIKDFIETELVELGPTVTELLRQASSRGVMSLHLP